MAGWRVEPLQVSPACWMWACRAWSDYGATTGRRRRGGVPCDAHRRRDGFRQDPSATATGVLHDRSNGDFDDAFREALDHHAQTPDVFEAARTRLAYGAILRRARRRLDAREQLQQAIDAFDSLGAVPWSEQARAELSATGQTARRRDPSTLTQLSPQELHIALSLAEGRTTRETAAALFLSPKTVEFHLRNVYRKLGINTRAELGERFKVAPTVS